MNTRILFTDLDGTLLNSEKNISPEDLKAVNELTASGHKFVISTGRPIQSAIQIARRYGWSGEGYYISSFNGGLIYDCHTDTAISKHPISRNYVRYIMDEAMKAGFHTHTYDNVNVVSERNTPELRKYCKGIMVDPVVVEDAIAYLKEDPIKVIAISLESRDKLAAFREYMAPWCEGRVAMVFSSPVLLEFANPAATKGKAVSFMCSHFNIPIDDSVAVGDEENDISMIETAGIGIAMCNGTEITKAAADHITENDNDHGGIAETIYKYILT